MSGSLELNPAPSSSLQWFAVSSPVFRVSVGWGASEPVAICSWGEAELKTLFQMELVKFPP